MALARPRDMGIHTAAWLGWYSKDTQTVKFEIFLKLAFLKGFDARPCRASDHLPDGRPSIAARSSKFASKASRAELLLRPHHCHHCHQCHRRCNAIPTQGCNKCASRLGMCATPVPHSPLPSSNSPMSLLFLHQVNRVLHYHSPTSSMSLVLCTFCIWCTRWIRFSYITSCHFLAFDQLSYFHILIIVGFTIVSLHFHFLDYK